MKIYRELHDNKKHEVSLASLLFEKFSASEYLSGNHDTFIDDTDDGYVIDLDFEEKCIKIYINKFNDIESIGIYDM
jgi:hypothetical protein